MSHTKRKKDLNKAQKTDPNYYNDNIKIDNFDISIGNQVLLKDSSLSLNKKRVYGLVGVNGSGKSTLMSQIATRNGPFSKIPGHFDIHFVEQEAYGGEESALESVISADVERANLLARQKELETGLDDNNNELCEIYDRLKEIESDLAESRASIILTGLSFTEEMKNRKTKDFSGGWRMRISLARALFRNPSLLLLDEPTNHLDLNAVIWLTTYLDKWRNILIIVSHDQDFLNTICTDILQIYEKQLLYYKGNYDSYKHQFEEKRKLDKKAYENQRKKIACDKAYPSSPLNPRPRKSRQPILPRPPKDYKVIFNFPEPSELDQDSIIEVHDVEFCYETDKLLFKNLDFNIGSQSRIVLVGQNGTGKSTLMSLIKGSLKPTSGQIIRNKKLKIAYFSQHFADQLDFDQTPIEYLRTKFGDLNKQYFRGILGRFGLMGRIHLNPIRTLSGGQKSRVIFAEICMRRPHLLLLDEPTNHLDLESIEALSTALKEYHGAVVLISHDSRLIKEVCTEHDSEDETNEIWVVGEQTVTKYDGDFDDYKEELIEEFKRLNDTK